MYFRLLIILSLSAFQKYSIQAQDSIIEIDLTFIEDFISSDVENYSDIPLEDIYDQLRGLYRRPLNINRATSDDFKELIIMNDQQILDLLQHRETYGDFISLLELQTIPGYDLDLINRIIPFLTVGGYEDRYHVSIPDLLLEGDNELFLRYGRTLQKQKGFVVDPVSGESKYAGDPSKMYLRFRHQYDNRFSMGFTMEKDPGEDFFSGSNPQGFDFMSFHLTAKNLSRMIKTIAVGDYSLSLGQGLIYYSRFANRKSSLVSNIKRRGETFHQYTSLNEFNFLRGAAITLNLTDRLEVSGFVSRRNLDGNVVDIAEDELTEISSITESGLHRTASEIENEKQLGRTTFGGVLKYRWLTGHVGLQAVHFQLDRYYAPADRLYNVHYFRGDQLTNVSLDYEVTIRNVHLFGEVGWGNSLGGVQGVLVSLFRHADLSILYRYLPADFHTFHGSTFAENSQNLNEEGLYVGLSYRPHARWTLNTYVDFFKHPWLRFRVNKPSQGQEILSRLTYYVKRKYTLYFQYKYETKERNDSGSADAIIPVNRYHKHNARIHSAYKINKVWEWRARGEYVYWNEPGDRKDGFLIYQDILYKPTESPFSFTGRIAYFNTDDFDTRLYAYENDLTYNYGIPAYFYTGYRFYLNTRYRFRSLSIEGRIALTSLNDRDTISSGNNEIEGNVRSDIKFQLRYSF